MGLRGRCKTLRGQMCLRLECLVRLLCQHVVAGSGSGGSGGLVPNASAVSTFVRPAAEEQLGVGNAQGRPPYRFIDGADKSRLIGGASEAGRSEREDG